MSNTAKRPLTEVAPVANHIVASIAPHCTRVEVAGSIRRQRPQVGDIEIVALPQRQLGLFGDEAADAYTALDQFLDGRGVRFAVNGRLYKQFAYGPYTVDLFLPASASHWGSIYTIRTGSHEFNLWLMTRAAPRAGMTFNAGFLYRGTGEDMTHVPTPEEADVFTALGLPFIPPTMRDDDQWLQFAEW